MIDIINSSIKNTIKSINNKDYSIEELVKQFMKMLFYKQKMLIKKVLKKDYH